MRSAASDAAHLQPARDRRKTLTRMPAFWQIADGAAHPIDRRASSPPSAGDLTGRTGTSVHWCGRIPSPIAQIGTGIAFDVILDRHESAAAPWRRRARRLRDVPGVGARVHGDAQARPPFTHTRTASTTSGRCPPRELRSVATLLTLTLSFTGPHPWSSQMLFDGVRDLGRPALNLLLVLALEHHAQTAARCPSSARAVVRGPPAVARRGPSPPPRRGRRGDLFFSFTRTFTSTCG